MGEKMTLLFQLQKGPKITPKADSPPAKQPVKITYICLI